MDVDFGVEVNRAFECAGEVYATETPAGMMAMAHAAVRIRRAPTSDGTELRWLWTAVNLSISPRDAPTMIHGTPATCCRLEAACSWTGYGLS
jgi:hypothetical protein